MHDPLPRNVTLESPLTVRSELSATWCRRSSACCRAPQEGGHRPNADSAVIDVPPLWRATSLATSSVPAGPGLRRVAGRRRRTASEQLRAFAIRLAQPGLHLLNLGGLCRNDVLTQLSQPCKRLRSAAGVVREQYSRACVPCTRSALTRRVNRVLRHMCRPRVHELHGWATAGVVIARAAQHPVLTMSPGVRRALLHRAHDVFSGMDWNLRNAVISLCHDARATIHACGGCFSPSSSAC
jgi:hypothetical protein